jgi:LmbE family N-acetylglucosaminyl deacetylase
MTPRRGWRWVAASAGLAAGAALAYAWQPQRVDWLPRRPPRPHPWLDPERDRLFARGTRVAVVTAHPDDAEFYLGGLLPQLGDAGARLALIVVTDGDKGYQPFADAARNRRIRREEQDRAAAAWGAGEVVYFGYPDSRFRNSPELDARLARELQRLEPEYVLTFDADYPPRLTHRDHLAVGAAAAAAAARVATAPWLLRFSTSAPNFAVDVTPRWRQRWELLHRHPSQFARPPRRALAHRIITAAAIADGRLMGVRYAEGLRGTRLPGGGPRRRGG